jgi:hypothetical protein
VLSGDARDDRRDERSTVVCLGSTVGILQARLAWRRLQLIELGQRGTSAANCLLA